MTYGVLLYHASSEGRVIIAHKGERYYRETTLAHVTPYNTPGNSSFKQLIGWLQIINVLLKFKVLLQCYTAAVCMP